MAKAIRITQPWKDDFTSIAEEHADDVEQLARAFEHAGYEVSSEQAAEIWWKFSDEYCAMWLVLWMHLDGDRFKDWVLDRLRFYFDAA